MLSKELADKIVEALKPIDPYRVILFGSHAWGEPKEGSDIDLYVVTLDEGVPSDWSEKNRIRMEVARALLNMKKEHDIDLIVHTKGMSRKFFETRGLFPRLMKERGIILI